MDQNDETILNLLATDLNRYYELLWQKYIQKKMYAYVFCQMKNPEDTEDVIQETSLRVYNALSDYSPEEIRSMREWLRPWLYKVTRSACLTHLKKQKRLMYIPLDDLGEEFLNEIECSQAEQTENILESWERKHNLENLVTALPEKYRKVIDLHYFEGLRLHEIAEVQEEQDITIRQRKRRALTLLRKAFEREG